MPRIKKDLTIASEPSQEIKTSVRAAQRKQDRPRKTPKRPLMELIQQDGKNYNKKGVKSIDELLNEEVGKYSTSDVQEYEKTLDDMNVSDLQRHAISVQILPKEDRRLLKKLLIKQFQINNSAKLNTAKQVGLSKPISKEVLDILAEGR